MFFLGYDFIILSLLLFVAIVIFLFSYRKKIFSKYYQDINSNSFTTKIKTYLTTTYPKFEFDFTVLQMKQNNQNPDTFVYLIVDEFIKQYIQKDIKIVIKQGINKDDLWSEYTFLSNPIKEKLPTDWLKRKKLVFKRDKNICLRCSKTCEINNSVLALNRPLKDGGKYYIENLYTLCRDCNKIKSNNTKELDIKQELYKFTK
jgi:hypothetical protein